MEELASYVTVLLVAPESLLGLVDASLRLPHAQALTFLRLREDFKSARDGATAGRRSRRCSRATRVFPHARLGFLRTRG